MEELELIVQRMMDAGESEENIKAVVQEYSAGKQIDPVNVEADAGSKEDTASSSDNGSLEQQEEISTFKRLGHLGDKFFKMAQAGVNPGGFFIKKGLESFGYVKGAFDNLKSRIKDEPVEVPKDASEQYLMGRGFASDPKSFLQHAYPGLHKFSDNALELLVDNTKDIEESGYHLMARWYMMAKKGGSLSEEENTKLRDEVKEAIALKDYVLQNHPNAGIMNATVSRKTLGETQDKIRSHYIQYDNTITEEIAKGSDADWSEIGGRITGEAFGTLPFTLMSLNPYTAAYMAAGLAGDKFVEEMDQDPDRALWRMSGAAVTTGAVEVADAFISRKLLRGKGLLPGKGKGGAQKAVEQMNKGIGKKVLDVIGLGVLEGGTEITQNIANKISDYAWLDELPGQDADGNVTKSGLIKAAYETMDEGIIGAFSSGGFATVSSVTQSNKALKERVEFLLMPESVRKEKAQLIEQYTKRDKQIKIAKEAGKTKTAKALEKLNKKALNSIMAIANKNKMVLDNLKGNQLTQYAKNIDIINGLNESKGNKDIDAQINNLNNVNNNIFDKSLKENYGENVSFTEVASKQLGLDTTIAKSNAEFERLIKGKSGKNINGAFIGEGKIIINQRVALKQGAVGVGSHEILHPILNAMVGDAKSQKALVNKFKQNLNSKQLNWVEGEMKAQGKEVGTQEYFTEYFNVFSEGLVKNRIDFNESVFTKIKNYLTKLYKDKGFDNIDFESGRGAYNFMKAYDKSIKSGKISQDILNAVDKDKVSKAEALGKIQLSDTKAVKEVNDIYNANENKQIAGFEIADKYRGMAESIFNALKEGSNYTQNQKEVFEGKKEDMLAMMLYDKIPSQKEDSKARNVVGLVQDFESKKQKYNNVAAYVNTFFKERSKEVFKYFSKDAVNESLTKEDGTLKKSVSGKTNESSNVDQGKEARKLNSFDKLMKGKESFVDDTMKKSIISKLTKNLKTAAFKGAFTAENITAEIKKIIKQEIEKSVVKRMGKISKTKAGVVVSDDYKSFHSENFDAIVKALPVSVIKKKYFSLFEKKNIGREKTAQGNAIFEIKPTSKGKFGAYFTIGGYTTLLARQKSLANEISAELIKDQTTILKQDVDFMSELAEVADMSGVQVTELVLQTELESLANQFDRKKTEATKFDRIQFSKNFNNDQVSELNKKAKKIIELSKVYTTASSLANKLIEDKIIDNKVFTVKEIKDWKNEIQSSVNAILSPKNTLQSNKLGEYVEQRVGNKSDLPLIRMLDLKSYDVVINGVKKKFSSFAEAFREAKLIERQRKLHIDYFESKIETLDDLVSVLKWFPGHTISAGARYFMKSRNQSFAGMKDLVAELNKILEVKGWEIKTKLTIDGKTQLDKVISTKTGEVLIDNKDTKVGDKTIKSLRNRLTSSSQDTKKTVLQYIKELPQRIQDANEAWNTMIDFLSFVDKNGDNLDFGMTMMSLKSNMSSMLKAAAPLTYYFEGSYVGKLVYEHLIPTEYVTQSLTKHFKIKKINLNSLQDQYKVAIVPKTMDDNINGSARQENMPTYWQIGMEALLRYFDDFTFGFKNMYALKNLQTGDIVGKKHAKAQFSKTDKTKAENFNKAMMNARNPNAPEKGISVFDFDDTIAQSNSKVLYELPGGKKGKINATEFALQSADLEAAGAIFDFSEFSKVIEGKKGPLFDLAVKRQGKFTSKDIFILTARPQNAAYAIHAFLKGLGLTIPIGNITGLADGKASAKADWIIGKAAEGYNNFYFADDAYKNVKAVQKVLDIIDVKRDVQLAKIQFSRNMDETFNDILEQTKKVDSNKRFSKAAAESRGRDIGKWKFFLPPSAEDFVGLLYNFLSKGKVGEQQMEFFNKALVQPFARAMDELNRAKQAIATDFRALKKTYPEVRKMLAKITPYNNFTYDTAVRVYIWNKKGIAIPGLSKTDIKRLTDIVENNSDLKDFADTLEVGVANNNYTSPSDTWLVGNIATDLKDITDKVGRKQFLQEWLANKEVIFSKENLNKIEAIYGSNFREALEDMLYRMENGTNRSFGSNRLVNSFSNWVNNSVGAIMFFNMRSAILQTISFVNFVNWSDNNPLKFAAAILNVKQFSTDFVTLFNSDMLKQRRAGIGRDVNESEIAEAMSGAKNKPRAILNYLLRIGFTPTQIADSFAISMGGAAFYRNRINTYLKQGMTKEQALDQAFKDFQETTEVSQQSSRPDMISQQQAGPLGRLILAFQNTPMQYTRLMKKAFKDLINGRGDAKTNLSKIVYYGVVQNIIFASMQSALFAMLFDDDDDEDKYSKKKGRIANTMTDSILRGSGLAGAGISTIKNVILKFLEQEEKGWNADHAYTVIEAANFSPPIGSKLRKMYSGIQTYKFNKDVIADRGLSLNNPAWQSAGNFVSAATNIPMDRAVNKYNNLRGAANNNNEAWQRIAMALGWSSWDVDAEVETGYKDYKAKLKKIQKRRKILNKRRDKAGNRQEIINKRREILRNRKK